MSGPSLRSYQRASLEAIVAAARPAPRTLAGMNRLLVKKPTGTGKTVTFAAMLQWPALKQWLDSFDGVQRGARMLVIAHREELLDQAAEKIQAANPGIMVSVEQGDRHANSYSDVIVASIQTLAAVKFRRLHRLLERHTPRIVIVDEAHHAAASSYRTALVHLGFLPPADASESGEIEAADFDDIATMEAALHGWDATAPKDRLLVGVTATPNRSDAIGLGCVFQTIAYSYGLKQAIEDGYLVPLEPWAIETDTALDDVRLTHGDFNQRELADAVNNARRNKLAVAAHRQHAAGLPTLGFTVDIAHAHDLAAEFVKDGARWVALSGETPKEDRRIMLRQYRDRQIDGIANCMVLTEGTDLPLTECILHAKPTKSATLYEQMTGRGLRINPGKSRCVVIDLVDVARRHSLQAAPVLYGLPPGINAAGDDLRKMEGELDALREKHPNIDLDQMISEGRLTLAELSARASRVDVWAVPDLGAIGKIATMNWIRTGDETYRLQYPWADGNEILVVSKDLLGHFDVSCTLRPVDGSPAHQRTLAKEVTSAADALRLAEQFVAQERRTAQRLTDRSAPWREKPASDKQLGLLRKLKVPHNPTKLTMGQASDLINLSKARSGR